MLNLETTLWIYQHSGSEYDLDLNIDDHTEDCIWVRPYNWYNIITELISDVEECCDIIEDNKHFIPDSLPNWKEMKHNLSYNALNDIVAEINRVKRILGIDVTPISSYETALVHVDALQSFVSMLLSADVDYICNDWYDSFEESNDNILSETFNINKNDIRVMQDTARGIREDYFESLEDE